VIRGNEGAEDVAETGPTFIVIIRAKTVHQGLRKRGLDFPARGKRTFWVTADTDNVRPGSLILTKTEKPSEKREIVNCSEA
jgi:hypothetical protein